MIRNESVYNTILVVLIFGIIFSIILNFFIHKSITYDDVFSELYFEDPRILPNVVDLNKSYNVSFTFTNFEKRNVSYFYVIEYGKTKYTDSLVLENNGKATINFKWIPDGENMGYTISSVYFSNSSYSLNDSSFIPVSHTLDEFGNALHVSLNSFPLSFYSNSSRLEGKILDNGLELPIFNYSSETRTLSVEKDYLVNEYMKHIHTSYKIYHPFTVKLFKGYNLDEPLEIYYWYAFR